LLCGSFDVFSEKGDAIVSPFGEHPWYFRLLFSFSNLTAALCLVQIPRKSTGLDIINTEPKQGGRNQGPTVNGLRSNSGRLSGTIPREFRNVLEGSQAGGLSDESSSVTTTTNGAASWSLTEHSQSLLNQPLMPYSEWTIDFSELRIGVCVGIGKLSDGIQGFQICCLVQTIGGPCGPRLSFPCCSLFYVFSSYCACSFVFFVCFVFLPPAFLNGFFPSMLLVASQNHG
jgi:hypothetical protein